MIDQDQAIRILEGMSNLLHDVLYFLYDEHDDTPSPARLAVQVSDSVTWLDEFIEEEKREGFSSGDEIEFLKDIQEE